MPLSYAMNLPGGSAGLPGRRSRLAEKAPTKTSTPAPITRPSVAYEPRYPSTRSQLSERGEMNDPPHGGLRWIEQASPKYCGQRPAAGSKDRRRRLEMTDAGRPIDVQHPSGRHPLEVEIVTAGAKRVE